jgi:protoheme IX farnesyltransferase
MGALFIRSAVALWRRPREVSPMGLYKYSLLYLGLLFIAMGVDAALLG